MRNVLKFFTLLMVASLLTISCRQEESVLIEGPQDEVLKANSAVANLLQRTAMRDGSDDNIVDNASCFSIDFPFTVIVNGMPITVTSEEDLDTITIELSDLSEVEIESIYEY